MEREARSFRVERAREATEDGDLQEQNCNC